MKKAIVVYSGGMDSFTLMHKAGIDYSVEALSVDYGQRHVKELEYARRFCESNGVPHTVWDARSLRPILAGSALTDNTPVPEGHYADETMRATVVPNRNMVLISVATALAVSRDAQAVFFGAHAGDHAIYPDCRAAFLDEMAFTMAVANYQPVELRTPFLRWSKGQILEWGLHRGLDYGNTWTCYNGREKACGKCGSCTERLEAFDINKALDPLKYETDEAR